MGTTVTVRVRGMIADDRVMTLGGAAVMVTTVGEVLMIGTGGRVGTAITGAAAVRRVLMTAAARRRLLVSVTLAGPCLAMKTHSWQSCRRGTSLFPLLTGIPPVRLGQGGTQWWMRPLRPLL
jgi:hypothetical protein